MSARECRREGEEELRSHVRVEQKWGIIDRLVEDFRRGVRARQLSHIYFGSSHFGIAPVTPPCACPVCCEKAYDSKCRSPLADQQSILLSLESQRKLATVFLGDDRNSVRLICGENVVDVNAVYRGRVVKTYLAFLEEHVVDIDDEVLVSFVNTITSSNGLGNKGRVVGSNGTKTDSLLEYIVPTPSMLLLRAQYCQLNIPPLPSPPLQNAARCRGICVAVSSNFSDLGHRAWEAGFLLADLALARTDLFDGRHVVELGAGIGLSGMVIAQHCDAASVVLSDLPHVVPNLRRNLQLNGMAASGWGKQDENEPPRGTHVTSIDWQSEDDLNMMAQWAWADVAIGGFY